MANNLSGWIFEVGEPEGSFHPGIIVGSDQVTVGAVSRIQPEFRGVSQALLAPFIGVFRRRAAKNFLCSSQELVVGDAPISVSVVGSQEDRRSRISRPFTIIR